MDRFHQWPSFYDLIVIAGSSASENRIRFGRSSFCMDGGISLSHTQKSKLISQHGDWIRSWYRSWMRYPREEGGGSSGFLFTLLFTLGTSSVFYVGCATSCSQDDACLHHGAEIACVRVSYAARMHPMLTSSSLFFDFLPFLISTPGRKP